MQCARLVVANAPKNKLASIRIERNVNEGSISLTQKTYARTVLETYMPGARSTKNAC